VKRLLLATLLASQAQAMTILPPYLPPADVECDAPQAVNYLYDKVQCRFNGYPWAIDVAPVAYLVPKTGTLKLTIQRHGYTALPVSCTNADGYQAGELIIKPCAAFYPDQRLYGSSLLMNWGGPFLGSNLEGSLACAAIEYAVQRWNARIDYTAGFTLRGTSEGGTYAILQSVLMPCVWREFIRTVDATLPHTLFVKQPTGQYWRDPSVRAAWGGFDWREADVATAFENGRANNVYYRIRGATNDDLGRVDLDFFRLCDTHKTRCSGIWDRGGHSATGEPGVNLPRNTGAYPAAILTDSSGNQWGERGHYNAGLTSWLDGGRLYVRYQRLTGIGGGIPDQPETITVNATVNGMTYPLTITSGQTLEVGR
jgi:hypothetical protein